MSRCRGVVGRNGEGERAGGGVVVGGHGVAMGRMVYRTMIEQCTL